MNKPLMKHDFLVNWQKLGLMISGLTPLVGSNSLNATHLYKAKLSEHGRHQPVFIKQLVSPFSKNNYQQFCQEINALQACQTLAIDLDSPKHCGISRLLAYNLDKNLPFLMLPLYHGQTLKTLIQQNCLSFDQKITFAISLCHLIDSIPHIGYLHGDIKPPNIFITTTNQMILLDFGLSQALSDSKPTAITAGTPAYMSPEQFNGLTLTAQSDFYSLGIVLFELFTGKLPFYADNLHDWAVAHCQQAMPIFTVNGLSTKQTDILHSIFDKLLAKHPHHRPTDLKIILNLLSQLTF